MLAPPRPVLLHWVIWVTGVVEMVVPPVGQVVAMSVPVQEMVVTIVVEQVGVVGVAAL